MIKKKPFLKLKRFPYQGFVINPNSRSQMITVLQVSCWCTAVGFHGSCRDRSVLLTHHLPISEEPPDVHAQGSFSKFTGGPCATSLKTLRFDHCKGETPSNIHDWRSTQGFMLAMAPQECPWFGGPLVLASIAHMWKNNYCVCILYTVLMHANNAEA